MQKIIYIITVIICLSCNNSSNNMRKEYSKDNFIIQTNPDKESRVLEYKDEIMKNGSEKAYARLFEVYVDQNKVDSLLPYTITMIEKHKKYNWICRDVFFIKMWDHNKKINFMSHSINNSDNIPPAELDEVLKCLKKCGNNNDHEAVEILIEYYDYKLDSINLKYWQVKQKKLPPIKYPEN